MREIAARFRGPAKIAAIFRRDFAGYFVSPIAYVVLFVFLFIHGVAFFASARFYKGAIPNIVQTTYADVIALFLLLLIPPVLTMRLFAEERRSGTLETLLTAPVRLGQVVLGKFLAAWAFHTLLWALLLIHVGMLAIFGEPDWGAVAALYVGIAGFGAVLVAIGVFASAWTRNQIVAAIGALCGNMALFLLRFVSLLYGPLAEERFFIDFISPWSHFQADYARGLLDLRYLALYAALTILLLVGTVRVLEERR